MSDTENTPTEAEATAELAKLDDASLYIEQRHEDENVDRIESEAEATVRDLQEKLPELKESRKLSRYQRMKAGRERTAAERDQLAAENEQLRARLGESSERESYSETDSDTGINPRDSVDTAKLESSLESSRLMYGDAFDNAYQAFVAHCKATGDQAAYNRVMQSADQGQELVNWWNEMGNPVHEGPPPDLEAELQQGRQQQEFAQQLAARDEEIRVQTEVKLRAEAFARECSDFHEVMQAVKGVDEVPPVMLDLIRRSPVGPEIAYLMAKDFWDADTKGLMDHAQTLANDPIAQARYVGALEQVVYAHRGKNGGMSPAVARATKAPPPLSPVRGGASAPKDLHSLAKSDSADDYIRARRSAP